MSKSLSTSAMPCATPDKRAGVDAGSSSPAMGGFVDQGAEWYEDDVRNGVAITATSATANAYEGVVLAIPNSVAASRGFTVTRVYSLTVGDDSNII
jgi:hypothetical protein